MVRKSPASNKGFLPLLPLLILCLIFGATSSALAACSSPTGSAGTLLYNADNHVPQYCDNTNWKAMGSIWTGAGTTCSSPSAAAGTIMYSADWRVMQYCDGASWQSMGNNRPTAAASFGNLKYLLRGADLTTSADSKMVTGSLWFSAVGGTAYCVIDTASTCRFQIYINSAKQIAILGKGTGGGSDILASNTPVAGSGVHGNTVLSSGTWHHALFSFDLTDGANCSPWTSSGRCQIYLDGVQETLTIDTYSNANIDFTRTEHVIGNRAGVNNGFGAMGEFWLDMGTYMDLSQASVREKFRDSAGRPVYLGSDGSYPTGSAPEIFLSGGDFSTWTQNKGTGGGFTRYNNWVVPRYSSSIGLSCRSGEVSGAQAGAISISYGQDVWGDGTYIYVADQATGVKAFTFDGSSFTLQGTYDTTGSAYGVWGDGTYIYVADYTSGITAFTFDGSSFTLQGTYDTTGNAVSVWGDGTYIYVADQASGIAAFTFDGSSFTLQGTYDTTGSADDVWGDGNYIYLADQTGGLRAFSFNGSTFTLKATYATISNIYKVSGDGTYIYAGQPYVSFGDQEILVLTFNGSAFTLKDGIATDGSNRKFVGTDGTYFYVGTTILDSYKFNGSVTSHEGEVVLSVYARSMWNDDGYVYVVGGTGPSSLYALKTGNPCSCSSPTGTEGQMIYNSDYNVYQYCNGQNWIRMGQ
jgi:hypothetical protein